jgi:hypothetical protein
VVATPAGFEQENENRHLGCPTALKRAFAGKGQFRKLSNLPLLPDKPIAVGPAVDHIHPQRQPRRVNCAAPGTRQHP